MMYRVKFQNGDTFETDQPDYWQRGYEPWEMYHDRRCPDIAEARVLLIHLQKFVRYEHGILKGYDEDSIKAQFPNVLKSWKPKRRSGIHRDRHLSAHVMKLAHRHTKTIPPYLIPKITEIRSAK